MKTAGTAFAALSLALAALSVGSSCSVCRREAVPMPLAGTVGTGVKHLWAAHGGYDAWREFAGMTFRYRVAFADGTAFEEDVAVLFDEASTLWLPRDASAEPAESAWVRLTLAGQDHRPVPAAWSGDEAPSPRQIEFALLSLRHLAQLPFGLASPGWEARVVLPPPGASIDTSGEIEAVPRATVDGGLGPYLIPLPESRSDAPAERLARLFYASCHPAAPRDVFEVELADYVDVQGIAVATTRIHSRLSPVRDDDWSDPFALPGIADSDRVALVETLRDVRFLTPAEVADLTGTDEADDAGGDALAGGAHAAANRRG